MRMRSFNLLIACCLVGMFTSSLLGAAVLGLG